jgi:AmmeMemoRadiSam system protein B
MRELGSTPAAGLAGPAVSARPFDGCRGPAVAGVFYPAEPARLAADVDALLSAGAPEHAPAGRLPALVVPHAGYRYSGQVAAAAYALARRWSPAGVVLLGPAHFVPLTGSAVPRASEWSTPLGPMPVDPAARERALTVAGVRTADEPHAPEHSLEVQLPFLQRSLAPTVPVLPVVTAAPPDEVADLLDAVVGTETLVVGSTDLSHHLPDVEARRRDHRTLDAVLALDPDRIGPGAACGADALRGLLAWAGRTGRTPTLLSYRTSADATGDTRRVVGYAALALA